MRIDSAELDREVLGTSVRDSIVVNAFRNGELLASDLPIASVDFDWDITRKGQISQATFVIADPDGRLAPWGLSDTLSAAGTWLQPWWVSGTSGIRVPLGRFYIDEPSVQDTWRYVYRNRRQVRGTLPGEDLPGDGLPGGPRPRDAQKLVRLVHSGSIITVRTYGVTGALQARRLVAEVPSSETALGEVRRLTQSVCSLNLHPDVVDRPIADNLTYGEERIDEVDNHLTQLATLYREGPDGSLDVIPAAGDARNVWTIAPARPDVDAAEEEGSLVTSTRSMPGRDLFNRGVARAETLDGQPLIAWKDIDTGPLSVMNADFGIRPLFLRSSATTQDELDVDAAELISGDRAANEILLPLTALLHPALQEGDVVNLESPTVAGVQPARGRVVNLQWGADGGVIDKTMELTVAVPAAHLELIADRNRRELRYES